MAVQMHVAYSSIRMEPVYMILGHSAGVAAACAAKHDVPVQHIDVAGLQTRLRAQEQILSLEDVPAPCVKVPSRPATAGGVRTGARKPAGPVPLRRWRRPRARACRRGSRRHRCPTGRR